MTLRKITDTDLQGRGVVGMEDVPQLTAYEMQMKVEEIVREVVIPRFNENADNTASKQDLQQAVFDSGAGDMTTAVYDSDNDGVVNSADNGFFDYLHSKTGTVHSLTGTGNCFRFVAVADWEENDSLTVNGLPAQVYSYTGERVEEQKLFCAGAVIGGNLLPQTGDSPYYKVYPFRTGAAATGMDGNTVTPVDDVTLWQKCAGLTEFKTLPRILADKATLAVLLADFNAMNYFIRSVGLQASIMANATAVGIMDKLCYQSPSCTDANTMEYGTLSHSDGTYEYDTAYTFRSHDSDISTKYTSYFGPGWVQWNFGDEVGEKWIYRAQFVNTTKTGGIMCRGVTKDGQVVNLFSAYDNAGAVLRQSLAVPTDKKFVAFRVIANDNAYLTQCKFWAR